MNHGRDPKDEADAILQVWGSGYPLLIGMGYPVASETGAVQAHQTRVQTSGFSDPTAANWDRIHHLEEIDDCARSLPHPFFKALWEHYIIEDYGDRSWRMQRDAAQIAFWSVWNDRRKLMRTRSRIEKEEAQKQLDVRGTAQA